MTVVMSIGLSCLLMVAFFCAIWEWARRIDNYALVDVGWAFGIGLTGLFWLWQSNGKPRHWVAAVMLAFWSFRLGGYLAKRVWKQHPREDSRYENLREIWKGKVPSSFFWFFQAQAVSVVVLAMPFLVIARDDSASLGRFEMLGVVVWLLGILGEGIADAQMSRFKAKNGSPSAVCEEGFWKYSRHPNYFFESLVWAGFYLFACGSQWGWVSIHAPAIIVYLLLFVTGIPPAEKAALQRKGEAYRRYQKTTSPFIPLPRRGVS